MITYERKKAEHEQIKIPAPVEIKQLRESLQERESLGITAAQTRCAELIHKTTRAWQQWEHGDRKMDAAFWELLKLKMER